MIIYTQSVPKFGNNANENDDYSAYFVDEEDNSIRCAISDGATESSFSGIWAKMCIFRPDLNSESVQIEHYFR
jgi:hypothetical protein